jgi:hypothetical protein
MRVDSSILMMEVVDSSALVTVPGKSEHICQPTCHGVPEDSNMHSCLSENLKFRWMVIIFMSEDQGRDCFALPCLLE